MAYLSTKADLKTAVITWLDRDDLTGVLDTWIELCESTIVRRVDTWFDEALLVTTVAAGTGTVVLSGVIDPESVTMEEDPSNELIGVSYERLNYWLRQYRGSTGLPRYFHFVNNTLYLAPLSDVDYDLTILGRTRLTPLTASDSTNSLLLRAPDVYVYGCLAESAPFLADDARIPVWAGRFEKALEELRLEAETRRWNINTMTRRPKNPL